MTGLPLDGIVVADLSRKAPPDDHAGGSGRTMPA